MPESKKVVIKLDIHDGSDKRKALKAVVSLSGIESLGIDKENELTIVGDVDLVDVVKKLKKWHPDILTVGPAKEPEKKPEGEKKAEKEKKGDDDEEAKKKKKKKKKKKREEEEEAFRRYMEATCRGFNPYPTQRFCFHPVEEDPTGCVIC